MWPRPRPDSFTSRGRTWAAASLLGRRISARHQRRRGAKSTGYVDGRLHRRDRGAVPGTAPSAQHHESARTFVVAKDLHPTSSVSATSRPCVLIAFPWSGFPLAAPLPSTESSGVTTEFPDFFGTTSASDSSEDVRGGLRLTPSLRCLPHHHGEAPPRSPDSRATDVCERAKLYDPGWHYVPLAFRTRGMRRLHQNTRFEAYCPARPPVLLRFAPAVTCERARAGLLDGGPTEARICS